MKSILINPGIIKRIKKLFAPCEDTNIASRNYAIGKYFIWKNQAAQAKTSITQGDTLVADTNVILANDFINEFSQIKYDETTASGNGWGNYDMGVKVSERIILAAWFTGTDYSNGYNVIVQKGPTNWGCKVLISGQGGSVGNTNASIKMGYAYIDTSSFKNFSTT